MNLFEFFTHSDVQLPTVWDSHKDFETFVHQRHDTFLSLIAQLDPNPVSDDVQRRKSAIVACCEHLRLALRSSFEGHPHEAYQHFDAAMQAIFPELNALAFNANGPNELGILYRVRQREFIASKEKHL